MLRRPGRLGFAGRVMLIMVVALVAVQILAASLYYLQRSRATDTGPRLPLPDQIAALVELLDDAPPQERSRILRAVNGVTLSARIEAAPPDRDGGQAMPAVERSIVTYLGDDAVSRPISVRLVPSLSDEPFALFRAFLGSQVRIAVGLATGDYLVVQTGGELAVQILGLPPGFWAGIAGFVVALLVLLLVARETRPLQRLAQSVERFGTLLEPRLLPERGAPELRALTGAVNRMQQRIAALVRERAFMLGALAHDLATYVTRLRLRVELLPEGTTRDRAIRDVEEMRVLVADALAFARATSASCVETFDLRALVARACDDRGLAPRLPAASPSDDRLRFTGQPAALARALDNLIDNALRHAGSAEVTLLAGDRGAEILVEDRGPGIPAAERERIFEPFARLDPSRNRQSGGSGLGLAIARQTVESHGGHIAVEERPGGGACFRIILPAAT